MIVALLLVALAGFHANTPSETPLYQAGDALDHPYFDSTAAGLVLQRPFARGLNYILFDNALENGFVRARFHKGTRLDTTLLLRAKGDGEELFAIAIGIEKDALVAYRFENGLAHPLATARLAIAPGSEIELTVNFTGPHFSAQVVSENLETLAALSFTAAGPGGNAVGLRAHSRQDAGSTLLSLAVLPANADVSRKPKGGAKHLLSFAEKPNLPSHTINGSHYAIVDAATAERLRRQGAPILTDNTDIGWLHYDPLYRKEKKRGLQPTKRGFDIARSYKDNAMVGELLHAYAKRFPKKAAVFSLGKSHQGRDIWAIKISDNVSENEDEPAVLLNAAHHGSELSSVEHALDAVQQLLEGKHQRFVRGLEIWVVPLVNPDGNHNYLHTSRNAGRKNARDNNGNGHFDIWEGVDLNRNYPFRFFALGEEGSRSAPVHRMYRGPAPASEPEVKAMLALFDREHFCASISFHTAATLFLSPYTIDGVKNPAPDVAWKMAEYITRGLPKQPNGRRYNVRRKLYSVDGTDQDTFFHDYGTIAYLLEGPYGNIRSQRLLHRAIKKTRPSWVRLFSQVLDRPRVFGHVRDEAGNALDAVVSIAEYQTFASEAWHTRPRDGRFDRFIAEPGRISVRVTKPGYVTMTKAVDVARRPRQVDFTLVKEK